MTTRPVLRRPGRPLRSRRRPSAAALAALVIVGQLLATVPAQAAGLRAAAAPRSASCRQPDAAGAPSGELLPGIQYEEAMAHAGDEIDFTPGGKVTVGFRPRAATPGRSAGEPAGPPGGNGVRPGPAAARRQSAAPARQSEPRPPTPRRRAGRRARRRPDRRSLGAARGRRRLGPSPLATDEIAPTARASAAR